MRSWESYIRAEEEINTFICQEHAKEYGIEEDTETYMEKQGIGCEEMPCAKDCPLCKS